MRSESSNFASKCKTQNEKPLHVKSLEINKGQHGQDSDVDSGIVAYGKSGQRIGSTSSTDTESSQESRQKIEYCSPLPKCDLRTNGIQLRTVQRESCLVPSNGPVKGDHTVLKECNRRPPTPLTVFPDTHPCVRFDEHLQLTEQSLRRSCRKLFATLYGQRFSYPSEESNFTPQSTQKEDLNYFRARSKTLPEQELRKHFEALKNGSYIPTTNIKQATENINKENAVNSNRKFVSWNLKNSTLKPMDKLGSYDIPKQISVVPDYPQRNLHFTGPGKQDHCCSFKTSVDSGLGLCRSRCTCRNSGESSSQSSTSSATTHYTNTTLQPSIIQAAETRGTLVKSNSCSKLSNMFQSALKQSHEAVKCQPPVQSSTNTSSYSVPLHKTSSCSNIIESGGQIYNVPVYNDNMLHVYAEVAAVVPDESDLKNGHAVRTEKNGHIYDTVKSPPISVISPSISVISSPSSQTMTHIKQSVSMNSLPKRKSSIVHESRNLKECSSSSLTKDNVRPRTPSDIYASIDTRLVPYRNKNYRENCQASVATVRPTSITSVRPHSGIPNGYLKLALKPTQKTVSQQNVSQHSSSDKDRPITEVEYAVVDKSKKNRFTTSLPTLNRFSSNGCIPDEDKNEPPIPPKKNLHKSDFALYRKGQSSSGKKSFFEKVHVLTKNAREAFQKTFSTERIYRPEQEERLEATGQKLARSKSFIKGLRASISRKRKKIKPPLAEVVPQASSNPVWDEQPFGPNSPVHVRGQLLQLNLDGSQVIELSKPPNKPFGFFVARGRVRNSKGVFVSRMRDQETQKQLAGLLDIGDEILEIEGLGVKDADILQVNDLMSNKNTLLLTVLPYICRKDI